MPTEARSQRESEGVNAEGGGGGGEAEGGLTSKPRSQSHPVRRRWAGEEGGGGF